MPARAAPRFAALSLLLVLGCRLPSPCEAQGGQCTAPDVACGPQATFAGFDTQCEPQGKCCVPFGLDAGLTCLGMETGQCQPFDLPCPDGKRTHPELEETCGGGRQCCAP